MTHLRPNIEEIVTDIKKSKLDDLQMMEKYQLDHIQLVFVLGKLAEDKRISFRRMINAVNECLTCGDLGTAEKCLAVIEKNFPKASGVKALRYRVENAVEKKRNQDEYQREIQKPSSSLEWFKSEFPNIALHPEIERMAKVVDIYSSKINPRVVSNFRHLLEPPKRLSIIAKHNNLFLGLSQHEANRMWHYLMLVAFAENGIKTYFICNMMDGITCDVCLHIASMHLPVKKVRERITNLMGSENFLPKKLFPPWEDLDSIPPDEKVRVCMENDWYLPPYCDNCRCQILPSLW